MPHACIGVDVIVGYPEETDGHFDESYSFLHSLPVSYLHVFTYSERANTRAVKSDSFVPMEIRRERNKRLRILSDKLKRRFYSAHIENIYPVLFEYENDNGFMNGYTSNYIRVRTQYDENLVGKISNFKLEKLNPFLFVEGKIS